MGVAETRTTMLLYRAVALGSSNLGNICCEGRFVARNASKAVQNRRSRSPQAWQLEQQQTRLTEEQLLE